MAELERLSERYRRVLQDQLGISVRMVDEATLAFEVAEVNLLLFLEDRDPEYLHLVAMFPPPEQELERVELLQLCTQVTHEAKVAKVILDEEGDLVVSAEMIVASADCLPTAEHLAAVLPRAITAIFNAINKVSMSLELLGISRAVYDEDDGSGDEGPADRSKQHPDKAEKRRPPSEDGE